MYIILQPILGIMAHNVPAVYEVRPLLLPITLWYSLLL